MSSQLRTAEEAKADHIRVMGENLGSTYHALWQQVASLHAKWSEYVVLFGTKESRVDLLNRVAPAFSRLVQDSLWENVLLHIARLTDPIMMGQKQNLTIRLLVTLIDDAPTKIKVQGAVEQALTTSDFARDWRNRHIAHSDLLIALATAAQPLKPASRQKVTEALRALANVLNVVSVFFLDSTSFFEASDGDAVSLLYVIDDGISADRARRKRLLSGQYDPTEYIPRDI